MPSVDQFDALVERGLQVISLRPNTKIPFLNGWTEWDHDFNRFLLQSHPDCNLGFLLGSIVDVEGDNERANKKILDLIGDYPHPCYSSTKSIHHLFATPDPGLRILTHQGIEFRGHGHQSALPPSRLNDTIYKWLQTSPFPVPPMPERLRSFYFSKKRTAKPLLKQGHTSIECKECRKRVYLNRKRLSAEINAFKSVGLAWTCQKCRQLDIRSLVRHPILHKSF